jgi:hypothetical protein
MRSRHCAAECRLKASGGVFDRWSSCIRSMSDLGSIATEMGCPSYVRFPLESDRTADIWACLKGASFADSCIAANSIVIR